MPTSRESAGPCRSDPGRRAADGARDKEATALTDLGVIALNEGDAKGAIASLERALAITVELGDTARESDVVGNLGMAMLAVRQPERARALFERELAHARAASDRFAEKVALERLGIASWNLRDFSGALGFFDQALSLARAARRSASRGQPALAPRNPACGARPARASDRQGGRIHRPLQKPGKAPGRVVRRLLAKIPHGACRRLFGRSASGVTVDHAPQAYLGGSIVASVMAGQSSAESPSTKATAGPGLAPHGHVGHQGHGRLRRLGFQDRAAETSTRSDSRRARSASITPACAARSAAASPTSRAGCFTKTARSANGRSETTS